ncbi:hypothetical protein AS850_05575 [Frondihabitans sp. 762G35]|uniref:nuclease-related domain-containing protein n=1 Tax=Frondihabitans sp. 762G35 TaxID=1446794 RepID=UPI000D22A416|nr:nuclease-related domain-containing protein [Frondihabitans sp. 762G35]ARC56543.1 hypothetical protein AS850_05575 [Frondihabitans sp. 762G35]
MTTPEPGDDRSSLPLGDRTAGLSVIERFWELQSERPPRGRVARILGASPLAPEASSWFAGAVGEIEVAQRLRALSAGGAGRGGGSWRVVHSVPVGDRGADIDHVVIGPPGVFTINTKNHTGRKVWAGSRTFLVDGHREPYLQKSKHEATRAAKLLREALGREVPVRALIVVVGAASLTVKQQPDDVTILGAVQTVPFLRRQKAQLSVDDVREITRVALRPRTWQPRAARADQAWAVEAPAGAAVRPARHEMQQWFDAVRQEVRRARRTRGLWAAGGLAALAGALVAAPALAHAVLG